ncbi:rCG61398, partial [Rattus norvegicus]
MDPANSVILRFGLTKTAPFPFSHNLPVRAGTPGTMALVIWALAWSETSVVLVQMASWRQRQRLSVGAL